MLCRLKTIIPEEASQFGVTTHSATKRHKGHRQKRGLGPLTPDEKYLGNVVSEGFSDFMVMFVVTLVLLLFTLYCLNPLWLFSIDNSILSFRQDLKVKAFCFVVPETCRIDQACYSQS